jgi:hypothetical protein
MWYPTVWYNVTVPDDPFVVQVPRYMRPEVMSVHMHKFVAEDDTLNLEYDRSYPRQSYGTIDDIGCTDEFVVIAETERVPDSIRDSSADSRVFNGESLVRLLDPLMRDSVSTFAVDSRVTAITLTYNKIVYIKSRIVDVKTRDELGGNGGIHSFSCFRNTMVSRDIYTGLEVQRPLVDMLAAAGIPYRDELQVEAHRLDVDVFTL